MAPKRGFVRREVMIPGNLLPYPEPGKFHGVITGVSWSDELGQEVAAVKLSDEKIRLKVPWNEVLRYVLDHPVHAPRKRARQEGCFGLPSSFGAQRGRNARKPKPPPDPSRSGTLLLEKIAHVSTVCSEKWPLGTQLWLKMRGSCPWPVLMWCSSLCRKKDMSQLLAHYKPGLVLVRFYGEHSSMWVKEADLAAYDADDVNKLLDLKAWGREHHKPDLIEAVLEEVENAVGDTHGEVERMQELERLRLAVDEAGAECCHCHEEGATMACIECDRAFHSLCLTLPALKPSDLLEKSWPCPVCACVNQVGVLSNQEEKELAEAKMGLTPDWIIDAAAFTVLRLEPPTPERPYIKNLLDPCTNSMAAPNIPAEVLYDKKMNGLKLSNSWAGHYILLNPPYTAAALWRFVNRAIDEVENDNVPAVLLVCRNSTDTAYFQRLRPYPRVMLRRVNTRFKDYNKTPIGFGVCMFAIAKSSCRELYGRFYEAFSEMGEMNIPVDRTMMLTGAFTDLLERLRMHAEEHFRDHWIQCTSCGKWRILNYLALMEAKDSEDWTCRQLRPPYSSCGTPLTKREAWGGRYAVVGADGEGGFDAYSLQRPNLTAPLVPDPTVGGSGHAPVPAACGSDAASMEGLGLGLPAVEVPIPSAGAMNQFFPAQVAVDEGSTQTPTVLSAIELARHSRVAGNRAYLASLQAGPSALATGLLQPLGGDHTLVIAAAQHLAQKASLSEARAQVEHAKRQLARASEVCQREDARLKAAILANQGDLQAAHDFLRDAKQTLLMLEPPPAVPPSHGAGTHPWQVDPPDSDTAAPCAPQAPSPSAGDAAPGACSGDGAGHGDGAANPASGPTAGAAALELDPGGANSGDSAGHRDGAAHHASGLAAGAAALEQGPEGANGGASTGHRDGAAHPDAGPAAEALELELGLGGATALLPCATAIIALQGQQPAAVGDGAELGGGCSPARVLAAALGGTGVQSGPGGLPGVLVVPPQSGHEVGLSGAAADALGHAGVTGPRVMLEYAPDMPP